MVFLQPYARGSSESAMALALTQELKILPGGRSIAPGNFNVELFVVRVREWGGYAMVDCDIPLPIDKFCSTVPAFAMEARPVIPVERAVRVELEAIKW